MMRAIPREVLTIAIAMGGGMALSNTTGSAQDLGFGGVLGGYGAMSSALGWSMG